MKSARLKAGVLTLYLENKIKKALLFPPSAILPKPFGSLLTVHMLSCFVFSAFIGLASFLLRQGHADQSFWMVTSSFLSLVLAWILSEIYAHSLESSET